MMNDFLLYILKSAICLSLLHLVFRTMMRKEALFTLNRMVLITIVVISFIIPLLSLPSTVRPIIQEQIIPQVSFYANEAEPAVISSKMEETEALTPSPVAVQKENPFPYSKGQIIFFIYLAGVLLSLLVFLHGIISILLMIRKAQTVKKEGYFLFTLEKNIAAFSFWKMVFISRADYEKHGKTILTHELQHIRLGHFYDLMLMEIIKMIHWFNPIIYWLINDLKAIHEFQADKSTLTKGIDANKYQLLIIEKGVGSQRFALANSFNHCQIKKRITMMNQSKTSKAGIWKVATFLPLLALLLMAFGKTGENVQKDSPSQKDMQNQEKAIVKESTTQSRDSIYSTPEVLPQFPGGEEAMRKFIVENIHYPDDKTKMKAYLKEKVLLEKGFVSFIINSQGKVINIKLVKSIKNVLDTEAVKAVPLMPDWIPAKDKGKYVSASYTLPFNFALWPDPSDKNGQKNNPSEKLMLNQEKSNKKGSALQSRDSIYLIAELMPEFPGGEKALRKYLRDNIKYPPTATKANIQGKVFVAFVITSQGKIINPKIVRSVDAALDAEALRVVSMMPDWTPAKDKGKPVSMSYTIPINFVLSPGPSDKNVQKSNPSEKKLLNQEKPNEKGSLKQSNDSIYTKVEVVPQFPGGNSVLNKFLQENLKYPKEASAKHIQGKVFVSFIINKEGKILNPKVTKGVDPLLDAEALRVVKQMPNWIPGKEKGKTVNVSYSLPLNFVLE